MLKDAGLIVYHVVPTLKAALKAVEAGVDGLVVEGGEGGGFKSPTPVATMVLLPSEWLWSDAGRGVVSGIGMGVGLGCYYTGLARSTSTIGRSTSSTNAIGALSPGRKPHLRMRR